MRNTIAFYLGWVLAAANINLGIIVHYCWGASKLVQMIIFWVIAPLTAIGATILNGIREGKRGILSCLALWLSVIWGFVGCAITSNGCFNGRLTMC